MKRPTNEVSCHTFSIEDLTAAVRQASGAVSEDPDVDQVAYLGRYALWLGARSFVVERHYVDRHFAEEFSLYYARCLNPPPSVCHRIHFFSRSLSEEELDGELVKAVESPSAKAEVEKALSASYLGFTVIRPLPHVPIGRTLLRSRDDQPERHISTLTRNTVHLLGLELSLTGLAFQQQDRAVGACATAALWMAMSRVARLEGSRAPTPAFIAEAAARHNVSEGRPLPSRGLTQAQLTDAIRECGFAPEILKATGDAAHFLAMVHCYLRSGLPVILVLDSPDMPEAHAVTAVGYRLGSPRPELAFELPTRSMRIDQLYVHDDRLGPYARAGLELRPREGLFLDIERDEGQQEEPLLIRLAIVPVYPKLRVSAEDISAMASRFAELVWELTGDLQASCEMFFVRAGSYLEDLVGLKAGFDTHLPAERLTWFMRCAAFSRWVCITRWWSRDDRPLVDFIYDTTDVVRVPHRVDSQLLGMVIHEKELREQLELLGVHLGIPVL